MLAMAGLAIACACGTATARDGAAKTAVLATAGFGSDFAGVYGLGIFSPDVDGLGRFLVLEGSIGQETSPEYQTLNGNPRGDEVTDRFEVLAQVTAGVTYPMTESVYAIAGLGYASGQGYTRLRDGAGDLGGGSYYIEDPSRDDEGVNVQAGVLGQFGRLSALAAYNTFSEQVVIGVGLNFTLDWDLL